MGFRPWVIYKDKVYALVGSEHDGKPYTHVYMNVGNEDKSFLIKGSLIDIGALLMEADDNDWKC